MMNNTAILCIKSAVGRMHLKKSLTLACVLSITGCSTFSEVKPWQKNILALPEMTFGSDGNDDAFDDHIYFSKEASSGGRGFGGGGCGCN